MRYANWETAAWPGVCPPGVPALVGRVLAARGIVDGGEAREFLRTDTGLLHEPGQMKDLPAAAARIRQALERGETIAVYGDYDVDGVTATCLLYDFFRRRGGKALWYVPRRLSDGYGLNRRGLESLKEQGAQVVVTVDCGITAVEEVEYAKSLGLEVVITDHHACKDVLPDALAVVDPHRGDCPYPFKGLAGVGVALKLAMALGAKLEDYADLAALGTVADVMPLLDENRAIVAQGLWQLNNASRPGVRALLNAIGASEPVTAAALGYTLAPRLNAAGRLGVTEVAVELLLSESLEAAEPLAQELCELNRRRQTLEGEIFQLCVQQVEHRTADDPAIVLAGENWHQGVVGIVASRLAEQFHRPAFMISLDQGVGKGSCRSVGELSLFEALENAGDLLEGFGGHAMAAGFTVREENIPALRRRLNQWVADHSHLIRESGLRVDVALEDASLLTLEEVTALDMLEPLGTGNARPVFSLRDVTVSELSRVGMDGKHMRFRFHTRNGAFPGIFFSCPKPGWDFRPQDRVEVAFTPQVNEFRGRRSVQLVLQDIRHAARGWGSYTRYHAGEPLSPAEARALIPSRAEFETLWRYLSAQAPIIQITPAALRDAVNRRSGRAVDTERTLLSLEIFHERGLIVLEGDESQLSVTLRPQGAKVDLEQSPILQTLRIWADGP